MRRLFANNPQVIAASIFLLAFVGGNIFGLVLGLQSMREGCQKPCDGGAMAAALAWVLSIFIFSICGALLGGIIWLKSKSRSK